MSSKSSTCLRVVDMHVVCLSVCQFLCLSRGLGRRQRVQCMPYAVCAGSFGATFAKYIWLLSVSFHSQLYVLTRDLEIVILVFMKYKLRFLPV